MPSKGLPVHPPTRKDEAYLQLARRSWMLLLLLLLPRGAILGGGAGCIMLCGKRGSLVPPVPAGVPPQPPAPKEAV